MVPLKSSMKLNSSLEVTLYLEAVTLRWLYRVLKNICAGVPFLVKIQGGGLQLY